MEVCTPKSLRQASAKLKAEYWVRINAGYGYGPEFRELVREFVSDPCLQKCDDEFQTALGRVADSVLGGTWRFTILVLPEAEGDFVSGDTYIVYGKPTRNAR